MRLGFSTLLTIGFLIISFAMIYTAKVAATVVAEKFPSANCHVLAIDPWLGPNGPISDGPWSGYANASSAYASSQQRRKHGKDWVTPLSVLKDQRPFDYNITTGGNSGLLSCFCQAIQDSSAEVPPFFPFFPRVSFSVFRFSFSAFATTPLFLLFNS